MLSFIFSRVVFLRDVIVIWNVDEVSVCWPTAARKSSGSNDSCMDLRLLPTLFMAISVASSAFIAKKPVENDKLITDKTPS